MASSLDVIVMAFDGRGTGYRGDEIMHMVRESAHCIRFNRPRFSVLTGPEFLSLGVFIYHILSGLSGFPDNPVKNFGLLETG